MLTNFGRKIKQINVILGWLIFVLSLASIVWLLLARPKPTEKIESLKIENLKASLKDTKQAWQPPFTYEAMAEILNPNEKFNAVKISYVFEITDNTERVIVKKEGTVDVLAGERKLLKEELTIPSSGEDINFKLKDANWERANKADSN
ncbi:MAG: hypothetical protein V1841_00200 [Patescibacteria group bacterium]